ncbi:MAG TPA: peptidoglycan DD-metalloendopeptidase family protein [Gammaproteobacteria bacterium]
MKPTKSGIRHDYKDTLFTPTHVGNRRRWSFFAFGLFLPVVGVSLLLVSESNEARYEAPSALLRVAAGESLPQSQAPAALAAEEPPAAEPVDAAASAAAASPAPDAASLGDTLKEDIKSTVTASLAAVAASPVGLEKGIDAAAAVLDLVVNKGDTLELLFRRNKLSLSDLAAMVALPDAAQYLKKLRPGDRIQVAHREGSVLSLSRELDAVDLLSIERSESGFEVSKVSRPVERRAVTAHGTIRSSLFEAGMAAGMTDAITMRMAGIFEWDIDFIQDVREGDSFTVIYEELWRDGVKLANGDILAAEFVNQGKAYRAARYVDASGRADYYTPEGRSMRKAFLRAPVEFTRISSEFNLKRRHPILNTIRAHRGVDYAAPTGTPIRAAGDGKVIFRGTQGGYGNTVILQHGNNVTTLYGHLSKFAAPRVGSRVRQGEVIGYVGKSGLATGPHLHYEYRVNGVHRNPRTVPLPPADPVPAEQHADFVAKTAPLWEQLDLEQNSRLASLQSD